MDAGDFEALGLYDPDDPNAALQLELLDYLADLGATRDELVAHRELLPGLAAVLAIRGGPALSVEETAERADLTVDELRRIVRAAGFAEPASDAPVFVEGFIGVAAGLRFVAAVFGDDTALQLLRVLGSSMARVADAIVSAFIVNVEPVARRDDPVGLGVAKANVESSALLPLVTPALDVLLRQHLLAAQRLTLSEDEVIGFETQRLVVGFVDLVGSTELSQRLGMGDLGALLTSFETRAIDTVTARGRVVKLIGDEILYTAPDAASACAIALDLRDEFRDDPLVPPVRAGLAGGQVMLRDGDVFGPVVNLAARIVKVADPNDVLTTPDVAQASGVAFEDAGGHALKGVAADVELCRLVRD